MTYGSNSTKERDSMTLTQLYDIADTNNVAVYHFPLYPLKSVSVPCSIGIDTDQIHSLKEEKEQLAHELGHCIRYAFYTGKSPYEVRAQKEYKANKWAIQKLVPYDMLINALKHNITELWELAEFFDVSEDLIKKAFTLYEDKLIYEY